MKKNNLLLAYYGDDFTGSTDALEFLSRAGIRTVLFIQPPDPEQLERYPGLQAAGVAGNTRALSPKQMESVLRPAFTALRQLGAPHIHYKVCSTFDSSPTIGSIGKAIEVGAEVIPAPFVPLLVAAPALGRHCVFGNLFARMGIGSDGAIYRLDRHPSMSRHPVTPADESDLRLHLSRQTPKKTALLDILQIARPDAPGLLGKLVQDGAEVVLFDAMYEEQMGAVGALIDGYATRETPLFSVGSSGVEMALGAHWAANGQLQPPQEWGHPGHPGRAQGLLVVSGSCSPVTSGQIAWAVANGFAEVPVEINAHEEASGPGFALECDVEKVVSLLQQGTGVVVHTSRGADDERIARTARIFEEQEMDTISTSLAYGSFLGNLVRDVAGRAPLTRIVVAGGDTSSYAARAMGIEAVEMIAPLAPGAPLCKAFAPGSPVNGLQVVFKGGQVGREDFFGMVAEGGNRQ
ncbi:four-carbon acid sugar kinase family protein [Paraflavisolibacter sp. H34]|uniref:four-carbon acid sugar kinase family protein n=1 Tax=Huijunlia imazamoxiresistens TaxID=3127457 RepID=UPI003017E5A5